MKFSRSDCVVMTADFSTDVQIQHFPTGIYTVCTKHNSLASNKKEAWKNIERLVNEFIKEIKR